MDSRNCLERWEKFQKTKNESINSHKDKILIIVYGAYNPPSNGKHLGEKERLTKLCDHLKNEGYVNTHIVENIPCGSESSLSIIEKSFDCLEFADLNIHVFTCRGKTDSVARELTYAIEKRLLYKCKVFEEKSNDILAMGTLNREELTQERYTIVSVEKENDNDLHEHVSGEVYPFFSKFIRKKVM